MTLKSKMISGFPKTISIVVKAQEHIRMSTLIYLIIQIITTILQGKLKKLFIRKKTILAFQINYQTLILIRQDIKIKRSLKGLRERLWKYTDALIKILSIMQR